MNLCQLCQDGHPAETGLPTCRACYGEVAAALLALPRLLADLEAATPRTLARPAREASSGGRPHSGPSSPAHEAVIDLRAELSATVAAWAGLLGAGADTSPVPTLAGNLGVALAAPGGAEAAGRLLHLLDVARRRLDPPEVIRVRKPCPECGTRGLVSYDTGGPCWCTYCQTEVDVAV